MLNTQVCDLTNFYQISNPSDPDDQLAWLVAQLLASEQAGQAVMLAGHIPPTHYWCNQQWSKRYNLIVQRFAKTLRGQFFGHTHQDHITVQREDSLVRMEDKSPTATLFITPSLTTFSYQVPSYRVFLAERGSNHLTDYHQYRMNGLKHFNAQRDQAEFAFDLQYKFTQEYDLADMSPRSVWARWSSIMVPANQKYMIKFLNNYLTGQRHYDAASLK